MTPSSTRRIPRAVLCGGACAAAVLAVLLAPLPIEAQEEAARRMRDFWHVFAAYAIAWALVFGWAVSIARRMRRIEGELER